MMIDVYYINDDDSIYFPDPDDKDDLVAIGGDLSTERLIAAYRKGIFPWYSENEPILWWCPDPRFVLFPEKLHISKSLKKFLKKSPYKIKYNTNFEKVITYCSKVKRPNQRGTWITKDVIKAYNNLHKLGIAISGEAYDEEGNLCGGLFGEIIGKVFFGESMFHLKDNASKVVFVDLVSRLVKADIKIIDCQIETEYLSSFGAEFIDKKSFLNILRTYIDEETRVDFTTD